MTSLEGSSSRGGVLRKTATGLEPSQSVTRKRKGEFGQIPKWPRHDGESTKGTREREQE